MATSLRPTVLLIDDDVANVRVFERVFRKQYEILGASTSAAARAIARGDAEIDVAFVDYLMPDVDGATMLAELRLARPRTVRYLLTGYGDLVETARLQNDGLCRAVIAKPWDRAAIESAVTEGMVALIVDGG